MVNFLAKARRWRNRIPLAATVTCYSNSGGGWLKISRSGLTLDILHKLRHVLCPPPKTNVFFLVVFAAFAFNQYWLNNWEYNSKYVRLTETNPFSCQHCGKRYRWKSTLKRHESFECGGKEPAHKCPHCDYRAKQSGNLRVHIRKYHTDRVNLTPSVANAPLPVVGDLLPAASSGKWYVRST